jgi:hypothetical protein
LAERGLCGAAKRSPERRFHALYNHLSRSDVLGEAWKRVRSSKGAAGVDKVSIDHEKLMKLVSKRISDQGAVARNVPVA